LSGAVQLSLKPPSTTTMNHSTLPDDFLVWEQVVIDMPFLLEDLPFLNNFHGPEVSVYEVLAILASPPYVTHLHHTKSLRSVRLTTPYSSTTIPVANLQPTHDMHNNCTASATGQNNNSFTSYKKSCKICITHEIRCIPIEGSNPKICVRYEDKGLICEFEQKKPYVRTKH
jgi:hypothetical protein